MIDTTDISDQNLNSRSVLVYIERIQKLPEKATACHNTSKTKATAQENSSNVDNVRRSIYPPSGGLVWSLVGKVTKAVSSVSFVCKTIWWNSKNHFGKE